MARDCENWNWTIAKNALSGGYGIDQAQLAVLMDIREQLKALNMTLSVLKCPNFLRVPLVLDDIKRNTKKKRKRKKVAA